MSDISTKLTYLNATKTAIKEAIVGKGIEIADADTFRSYAEKISSIEAGGSEKINAIVGLRAYGGETPTTYSWTTSDNYFIILSEDDLNYYYNIKFNNNSYLINCFSDMFKYVNLVGSTSGRIIDNAEIKPGQLIQVSPNETLEINTKTSTYQAYYKIVREGTIAPTLFNETGVLLIDVKIYRRLTP